MDVDRDRFNALYAKLRLRAAALLGGNNSSHTLQATALVHEALINVRKTGREWSDRDFFFIATKTLRTALLEYYRSKRALKRQPPGQRVPLVEEHLGIAGSTIDTEALHEALERLGQLKERHLQVVELRFFGGFTHEEAAELLGISVRSAKTDWRMARSWLNSVLVEKGGGADSGSRPDERRSL